MVTRMGGNHQTVGPLALGEAAGDREHDAVAEGDDGFFHRFFLVVTFRDFAAFL